MPTTLVVFFTYLHKNGSSYLLYLQTIFHVLGTFAYRVYAD